MAITDNKVTQTEIDENNVQSAPDVLSDTPANNKAVFDNLTELFIGKYNDLIDDIDSDFLSTDEMGAGLTVDGDVSWRYALSKGTTFGFNFSGNITAITTGYRTVVGNVSGLTEYDFMDAYLTINSTDYECGDSWTSGNTIYTTCTINGVDISIYYDTVGGNITLEHTDNPLSTAYWNVTMYRGVAEKVPAKCLPADLTGAGYSELDARVDTLESASGKWNDVVLDKTTTPLSTPQSIGIGGKTYDHLEVASGAVKKTYLPATPLYMEIWIKTTSSATSVGNSLDPTQDDTFTIAKGSVTFTVGWSVKQNCVYITQSSGDPSSLYYVDIEYNYKKSLANAYLPLMWGNTYSTAYLSDILKTTEKTLSTESNFDLYTSGDDILLRASGNVVTISGAVKPHASITGSITRYTICYIPAEYRPKHDIITTQQGANNSVWCLSILTTGEVEFSRYRDFSCSSGSSYVNAGTSTWLPFYATWVI